MFLLCTGIRHITNPVKIRQTLHLWKVNLQIGMGRGPEAASPIAWVLVALPSFTTLLGFSHFGEYGLHQCGCQMCAIVQIKLCPVHEPKYFPILSLSKAKKTWNFFLKYKKHKLSQDILYRFVIFHNKYFTVTVHCSSLVELEVKGKMPPGKILYIDFW